MSDWSTDKGPIHVFDKGQYLVWPSRFATAARYMHWVRILLKQVFCWHPQWKFNAAGKMEISAEEAKRWGVALFLHRNSAIVPVIRQNFICARCGKFSHRYTPDFKRPADI